jgi:hypothetical protein
MGVVCVSLEICWLSFFRERIEITRAMIGKTIAERIIAMNTNIRIGIRRSSITGKE